MFFTHRFFIMYLQTLMQKETSPLKFISYILLYNLSHSVRNIDECFFATPAKLYLLLLKDH